MMNNTHPEIHQPRHTINNGAMVFPLPEIIRSGCLSTAQFALENEDWSAARVAAAMAAAAATEPLPWGVEGFDKEGGGEASIRGNETAAQTTPQLMENSARVGLCLVRSFANSCGLAKIAHHDKCASLPFPTEPSDYFISLRSVHSSQSSELPIPSPGKSEGEGGEGGEDFLTFLANWNESGENAAANYCRPCSGTDSSIPTQKETGENSAAAKEHCLPCSGTDSSSPLHSSFSKAGAEDNIAKLVDELTGKISSLDFSSNTNWTIMGITCTANEPEANSNISDHLGMVKQSTPMQVLGNLLYYVFSQGQEVPSSIASLMKTPLATGSAVCIDVTNYEEFSFGMASEDCTSDTTRSPKKGPRVSKVTIFSSLVDCKLFPVSICRLLSDLMTPTTSKNDYDDDGFHNPFSSFIQVMQDLEQMINEPSTFLHDNSFQDGQGRHRITMFGERYFGRKEEVKRIITVATRMEKDVEELGERELDLDSDSIQKKALNAVFISGGAGSGKSHLVRTVGNFLSEETEWIILQSKFERGMEHASRSIISGMFDKLITYLVEMKESNDPSEIKLSQRASESIWKALGGSRESASAFVDFLPSIPMLFGGVFNHSQENDGGSLSNWLLIQSLSKILDAVTELGRFIMICCDDMQWSDKASITIIGDLLMSVADSKRTSRRCLFVGLYRKEEIGDGHPLSIQCSYLQTSSDINTIEIELPSLSKVDILDMLMAHFCLPRRLVIDLATVVHQKTSGFALFVVNLLNSLMRESTIFYDVQKLRYAWDQGVINLIQTSEGVAGLIASNISSLPLASQQSLQILSCFGTQTDTHLIQFLENYQNGILSSLDSFIELGIIEGASGIVIFNHDLIQEAVYKSMPVARRNQLHLDLGNLLGLMAIRHAHRNDIFFAGRTMTSSLVSLACDQVNSAIKCVHDKHHGLKYAKWNLAAGKELSNQSDFAAALHYYSHGIKFLNNILQEDCWSVKNKKLCLDLHEGAAFSSYALGSVEDSLRYAEKVIEKLPQEDTLVVWTLLLKSLTVLSRHNECISKGLSILRGLGFDLPLSPTEETIAEAMADVERVASQFSVSEIANMPAMPQNDKNEKTLKILDSFYSSCFSATSPFLPLAACSIIKQNLENRIICQESTTAFATYGQFKIFIEGDYVGAKRYADVVRAISKKHELDTRAHFVVFNSIDVFFDTPRNLSKQMLTYSEQQKEVGDFHLSAIALGSSWRLLMYGGENLSLIKKTMNDRSKAIAKSKLAAKFDLLDTNIVKELIGCSPSSSRSHDMRRLQSEAESAKDKRLLFRIHHFKMMIYYWRGDFVAAEKASNIAASLYPVSKMPSIHLIYFTFFRGLVLFQRYSEDGNVQRLTDGKKAIDQFAVWANNAMDIFCNQWFLLGAEYAALSNTEYSDHVEKLYKSSIQAAQDHGVIHELGMANEMLGSYYVMHGRKADSIHYIKCAYRCYTQWGATAVAAKLLHDHDIDMDSVSDENLQTENRKHPR